MGWVKQTFESSIGCKAVMAVSGIALVGFLLGHLSGNLLVFASVDAIDVYAEKLRNFLPVLWVLRVGTLLALFLHIYSGIRLSSLNRAARPVSYFVKKDRTTTVAAKSMILSGLVVLSFIVFHLAHLTFRLTHSEFSELGPYQVRDMLVMSFSSPVLTGFYVLSIVLLMMHLSHGISSLFQTLGLNHQKYNFLIRGAGPVISTVLALGFVSIPLSILFGVIS